MENKQNLEVLRVLKTSSKGNKYESLEIIVSVNGKRYSLGSLFLDDTKIALLDIAGVSYAKVE